uniref:Portal protein n=1 Tax=Thermomicrobium roseum TaxID=500 RepID=A0A7C5RU72_THERO
MVFPPQEENTQGLWRIAEGMAEVQDLLEPGVTAAPKQPKRRRPSREQIANLVQRATEFWSLRDRRMDEDLSLYRMAEIPEGEGEVVIRNIPWVMVEKASSILSKQPPSIDAVPPENRLKEAAQAIEDFLRYAWEIWDRRWMQALHGPLLRDIAHFLCLRGWVTIRVSYNADAPPGEIPVDLHVCDPRQVYPQLGSSGLRYVVHRYWATVGEILDEWPEAEKRLSGRDEDEVVEVVAYYDDWWHYLEVDGIEVKPPTEHGYGFVPWVVATGLGAPVRATQRDQTHWTQEVGVSIFHGIKRAYRQLNRLVSQLATEVARVANPPTVYYYDPARPDNPQPIRLSAGATNFLYFDRERVEVLQVTPNPANAAPVMQALLDDVEKGGLPGVLWGVGQGSGFALTLQTDAAMDTLHPLTRVLEQVIEQVNQRALELIRDLHDGPVGYLVRDPLTGRMVSGQAITPDLIAAVGTRTVVRFRKVAPRDRVQMAQLAALLTDKKLISLETARDEFLGIENPQRENERVLADLAYLDPEVTREVLVPWALARTDPVLYELWRQAKLRKGQQEEQKRTSAPERPGGAPPPQAAPPGMPPQVLPPQLATLMSLLQHSQASVSGGQGEEAPPGVPGVEPLPGAGEIPGLV